MPEMKTRPNKYCSPACKVSALRARNKEKAHIARRKKRKLLADALRMWKRGASTEQIAVACGRKTENVSGFLLESKAYRKKTETRKSLSKWHEGEAARNHHSNTFRLESDFLKHAAQTFAQQFESVKKERKISGTRRKIDMEVSSGLWRFGVELKNGNRTARLDQTLGQAIVKCNALGGIIPVCCVPDDVRMDRVFLEGCASVGAIAGTLSDCINQMKMVCEGQKVLQKK
jgi:hypothetical protein